jgi:hypothetical protein
VPLADKLRLELALAVARRVDPDGARDSVKSVFAVPPLREFPTPPGST